jgi:hypothetical protein
MFPVGIEADGLEQRRSAIVEGVEALAGAPQAQPEAGAALQRDADVVEDCQIRKDGGDLKRSAEPLLGKAGRPFLRDVPALADDAARCGGQELADQIEEGGLPGAVGANQSVYGPLPNRQRHTVHREEAGEPHGDVPRFDNAGF